MSHPRRKHKGYRGPRATPWKYRLGPDRQGSLIRRSWTYHVTLSKDGKWLWSGDVLG